MAAAAAAVFRDLNVQQLSLQYSPSRWVKRIPPDQVMKEHCRIADTESHEARTKVKNKELDVVYDPKGKETQVDLFYPAAGMTPSTPLLVFIHGGYWQAMAKNNSSYFVRTFVDSGIAIAVLGYDLCPDVSLAQLCEQVTKGIAFIHQKFPKNKMFVTGHSAGGHLAAYLLYVDWAKEFGITKPFLGGAFLISGVFDLTPIKICPAVNGNGILQIDDKDVENLSPWLLSKSGKQVTRCPIVVAVAENDSPEFNRQTQEYGQLLRDTANGSVQVMVISERDHFDIMETLRFPDTPLTQSLKAFCWQE